MKDTIEEQMNTFADTVQEPSVLHDDSASGVDSGTTTTTTTLSTQISSSFEVRRKSYRDNV